MVAYNLLLSIFPVALVALFIAGRILRSQELQDSVLLDLEQLFPTAAETTLSAAVRRLQESSTTTGILAIVASVWFATSFWGALDTAFCQIYHRPCRSWVRQKLFALGMFAVVLLFIVASVTVPALQSLLVTSADDLPFGLSEVRGLVYGVTLAAGVLVLFVALCATYRLVPSGAVPWHSVWPGAVGATLAMGIVDYGFPLYLQNVTTLRRGHDVRLRADRARVVLRAGDHPARPARSSTRCGTSGRSASGAEQLSRLVDPVGGHGHGVRGSGAGEGAHVAGRHRARDAALLEPLLDQLGYRLVVGPLDRHVVSHRLAGPACTRRGLSRRRGRRRTTRSR